MLEIQNKLISIDIIEKHFVCQLNACKGACCWEGDHGAPLEKEEVSTIEEMKIKLFDRLRPSAQEHINKEGAYYFDEYNKCDSVGFEADGKCVFLIQDGIKSICAIEQAHANGEVDFKKPISCHLYPIRVQKNEAIEYEALNYDVWDICSAACQHGKDLGVPLYEFAKAPLIRKYGEDFYNELEAAAEFLKGE